MAKSFCKKSKSPQNYSPSSKKLSASSVSNNANTNTA